MIVIVYEVLKLTTIDRNVEQQCLITAILNWVFFHSNLSNLSYHMIELNSISLQVSCLFRTYSITLVHN